MLKYIGKLTKDGVQIVDAKTKQVFTSWELAIEHDKKT